MKFVILLISYMSGVVVTYSGSGECDSYYKPHPSECALFFQCSPNGTYILFTCPHDLHFNPSLNVCDYPNSAVCSGDPGVDEPTTIPDTGSTTDTPIEICNNGEYLPHETDCEAFYICISGMFIMVHCPIGTQFNVTSHECEVLEVECQDKSSKSPESTTEYTTENSAETTTESSTDSPSESEPSSDSPETTTTETASAASSEFSTETSTEALTEASTVTSTEISTETSTKISTEALTETSTEALTEASTDISTDAFTEALTEASTEVSSEGSTDVPTDSTTMICYNNEFWPAEDNCEAFYRCIGGQAFQFLCPAHKHYNANTKQCDEPEEAGCDVEKMQDPIETFMDYSSEILIEAVTETAIEDCVSGEYQPDDDNCEAFYRCFNGKFIKLLCPPGRHYNSITRGCDKPEEAGYDLAMDQSLESTKISITDISVGADASTTKQTCSNNEYEADESDCEAFYRCINGQFIRLFCPTGKYYNFNNRQCDEPEVAGCNVPAYY